MKTKCLCGILHLSSVLILVTCLFITPSSHSKDKVYSNIEVSRVVSVYDGDTFRVDIDEWPDIIGKNIGIRVLGIDTPEMKDKNTDKKAKAVAAKHLASDVIYCAEKIILRNLKRDKYFRILADVECDGKNLAKIMLDSGLAVEYNGGTKGK